MDLKVGGQPVYAYAGGRPFDPALPGIVFLHGALQDHSCWQLPARYFAYHGWAVLAPDLPGHGRSAPPPLPSVAAMAEWVAALMTKAELLRASLVGHSMGALVALEAARRYPGRVTSIALLGAAAPMPVAPALRTAAREAEAAAMSMINLWSHSERGRLGGNRLPGVWMFGANRRLMERAAPGVLAIDLAACNAYEDPAGAEAGVSCPALVLTGSRDQMTPLRAARALAASLPGARLEVLAGCGHALMAEAPDEVLDSLRAFLADRRPSPADADFRSRQ